MRNQKGITLVALIITIIVMVILAGVIIVSAIADGGVIDRAQGAMREKERGEVQDLIIASYVYKTGASTNAYAYLDMNQTAGNIWDNLTNNGFILKDGSGNEYGNKEGFLDDQEGSDGTIDDKIEINVEGDYGEYNAEVSKQGLTGNGVTTKTENSEGGNEPKEYSFTLNSLGDWGTGSDSLILFSENEAWKIIGDDLTLNNEYAMINEDGLLNFAITTNDEEFNKNGYLVQVICVPEEDVFAFFVFTSTGDDFWTGKSIEERQIFLNKYGDVEFTFEKVSGIELPNPEEPESTIEYYIFSIEGENGEAGYILKVDNENNTVNTYGFNIEGKNVNYGGGPLTIGQKVENETIINIDDGNGTTIPDNMQDGNVLKSGDADVGYKKGKNIYMPSGLGYYCYSLVEDIEKIAEIESLIATIN